MLKELAVKWAHLPNGEVLAYREAGVGDKVVLLLHGNMSSSMHFDVLLEQLADGYKLYALDLRGFGESSYFRPIKGLVDFAEDVAQFAELLGLTSYHVVGWSTGGGVALELAALCPQAVAKVVLINSVGVKGYPMYAIDALGQPILSERLRTREEVASDPVKVVPILSAYATHNRAFLRAVWNALIYNRTQPEPERYEHYLTAMLKQRNLVDVDYALVVFNMTEEHNGVAAGSGRLRLVASPVLVLHGRHDLVIPLAESEDTAELLGEQATLHVLEGCGHSPLTDNPVELMNVLRSYLA
ncbi:MAG: alpha/beta hydrolase [Peptococcaceae bacterium]|nr:alpha/beta hydrolase [Peptococcaceae bacterium]